MRTCVAFVVLALCTSADPVLSAQSPLPSTPGRHRVEVRSSADGSLQPSYVYLPMKSAGRSSPAPLVVMLHTWSFDFEQSDSTVEAEAKARGWMLLVPNFRGRNDHADACGSRLAQQDILDAVRWVRARYAVDKRRIYLLGLSGGGYMTMLMAGRYPGQWAAASAWVGISDMREWYAAHSDDRYGGMMRACFGGGPTESDSIRAEYRTRSPLAYLSPQLSIPLDLAAGRFDSTVAVSHTLRAFQAVAPGIVTNDEITSLLGPGAGLLSPTVADTASDASFGRRIFLRRVSGPYRVTVFAGGHEWLPGAAMAWLAQQQKR